jgi:hypothetical protein
VTLDHLAGLYAAQQDLRLAGLVAVDQAFAPSLTLADLESVFDVLDGEIAKAHYLLRRADVERRTAYFGTELDLLDLYLDTAFNLGGFEFGGPELLLAGRSQRLAPYLMRHASGATPKRPRLRLTKWWCDVIDRLGERRTPGWVWLGTRLLGVSLDEQLRFEREFKATQAIVRQFGDNPGHQDVVYLTAGPAERRTAVAGVAFRDGGHAQRRDLAERVGFRAAELAGTPESVVIGVDVAHK